MQQAWQKGDRENSWSWEYVPEDMDRFSEYESMPAWDEEAGNSPWAPAPRRKEDL